MSGADKELEQARKEAESGSRAKTEFLSNISHELKTPLTPIVGMVPLLLMDDKMKPSHRELLKTIESSAAELAKVIEDLIELSHLDTESVMVINESFDLKYVVASFTDSFNPHAETKGLKLGYRIASDIPDQLKGDMEILQKILIRIVSNAIKFTEQGQVDIAVAKENQDESSITLQFSVKDTGIGIPADKLEMIFQDFTQADGSSTRKFGGLGLGLTIVRKTITLLGGTLWAKSIEGGGSSFHFTLQFGI